MNTNRVAVERAISLAGGQTALARKIGVTPQAVQGWHSAGRIPLNRVLDVERATGIPRTEIMPEIFSSQPPLP